MIILRHNSLSTKDLFTIEKNMLKIVEQPYRYSLDYSLLNKQRSEVYGYIAGIFKRMGVYQTLGITTSDFLDFLIDVEKSYLDNPYHSFYHAVDVTMVLYHMLVLYDMSAYLCQFDIAMLMLAGLCHDIGHPGKNNQFEIACKTELAQEFNNLSVLESHSAKMTLDLFEKHDFLRNIEVKSKEISQGKVSMTKNSFRSGTVRMILATDMSCHFLLKDNISALKRQIDCHHRHQRHDEKLKSLFPEDQDPYAYFKERFFNNQIPTTTITNDDEMKLDQHQRQMMCNILIHAADISNPCRPWPVFQQLSRLVCLEFFRQGDAERELGLPVSPQMDRYKANPSKINVGFIDFIVRPYFESLCQLFTKANELIVRCDQNREEWLHLAWEKPPDPKDTHLPSIEESLGGSIEEQVMTVAPGSVNIPSSIEQDIRQRIIQLNRSISFNDQHLVSQCREWLLSPSKEEKEREMEALRRNSEGMTATLCHTLPGFSQLHKAFYSRRRKSEEVSHRLNASGMKNKMTTATGMTTTT